MNEDVPGRSRTPAVMLIGALLAAFGVLSYSASLTKSPTADEPVHLAASYIDRFLGDYRCNPEHPVLWKYWAAIFLSKDDVRVDTTNGKGINSFGETVDSSWPAALWHSRAQFDLANQTFYGPQHARTDKAFALGRLAMLLVGIALGAFIAAWAGWLGGRRYGPAAAVIAVALFALDPNMLAHSSLVTNDIALALCYALVAWTAWLAGRKLSLPRGLALALACGIAINVKFSALVCGPLVALMLIIRALMPLPWPTIRGRILRRRPARLAAAVLLGLACAAISAAVTWGAYGFRFAAGKDGELFASIEMLRAIRWRDHRTPPHQEPLLASQLPARVRAVWWVERHRLLPQAYTFGLLRFEKDAVKRSSFLCGEIRTTGWWYYYPAAMLFKTPIGTLGLAALALLSAALYVKAKRRRQAEEESPAPSSPSHLVILPSCHPLWTALCLLLPPAAYLAIGMASAFNIGIRHIFPIYPFIFIGLALPLAWLWDQPRRWGRMALVGLLIAAAAEVGWGYPNYLAFFNQACGGWRGGGKYLVDSNLDWGQDLPLLAEWQSRHPDDNLYLCYFGHADPEYYHIRYASLPGGYIWPGPQVREYSPYEPPPTAPGWLALSANFATGALFSPEERAYYGRLAHLDKPDDILGGSIYLYRYPKRP